MLENVGTAFRKLLLIIVVILAAALFISVLSILLTVITTAIITMVFALIIAPKETKGFFKSAGTLIDSWVKAFIKAVQDSGEIVKNMINRQNDSKQ